jgi:hypothetical protein
LKLTIWSLGGNRQTRNVGDGNIYYRYIGMDVKNRRYYWRVRVYDGTSWTTQTYSFVAQAFVLKWTAQMSTDAVNIGALASDINGDGIYEIFVTGNTTVAAYDGLTGKTIWIYKDNIVESILL